MLHMVQLRMRQIKKRRNMPAGDKVDFPHPRRKLLHCAKPVGHQPPVTKTVRRIAIVQRFALIFCFFCLPDGVTPVHPQNDKVDVHVKSP